MYHLAGFSVLALLAAVGAAVSNGVGEEGSTMGPVAFLWPKGRPWAASTENIGPCGSGSAISKRTLFPLSKGQKGVKKSPSIPVSG
jgi:hypothetical protein